MPRAPMPSFVAFDHAVEATSACGPSGAVLRIPAETMISERLCLRIPTLSEAGSAHQCELRAEYPWPVLGTEHGAEG